MYLYMYVYIYIHVYIYLLINYTNATIVIHYISDKKVKK